MSLDVYVNLWFRSLRVKGNPAGYLDYSTATIAHKKIPLNRRILKNKCLYITDNLLHAVQRGQMIFLRIECNARAFSWDSSKYKNPAS